VPKPRPNATPLSVELQGELGGEALSPKNFDVVGAMNYVSAFLDLSAALAEKHKEPLSFQGLSIEPGSVAFKIDVDQPTTARRLASEAGEMVGGRVLPPHGLRTRVARVVDSLSKLAPGVTTVVKVGRHETVIAPPRFDNQTRAVEEAELRVRVYRVGGDPARLAVISETDGAFTASLSHELAEEIANHLYKDVDLLVIVERTDDGRIADATVRHFHPLEETRDEAAVWRQWFSVAGSHWDDIDNIEAELEGETINR